MSVLIKGMKMPKCSQYCKFTEMNENWERVCTIGGRFQWHGSRLCDNCPMVEVPPHGRLIDADELYEAISLNFKDLNSTEDFMGIGYDHCIADTLVVIRQAPTIIEAEEEEDDSLKVQSR